MPAVIFRTLQFNVFHQPQLFPILLYYLLLCLIYLLALLPFVIIYRLSDFLAFLLSGVFRYRRTTIVSNLANAFPGLDKAGLDKLCRRYYSRMAELILETFKTIGMSSASLLKRCRMTDASIELLERLQQTQQSAFIVMGHHGNWEWVASACSLICRQPVYVLFKPLANKRLNNLLAKMRQRHGLQLIPMQHAYRAIQKASHQTNLTIFIADQSPSPETALWMNFLQQDTAVFTGVEKMAIKTNRPVIFFSVIRVKRGYYQVHAEMLVEKPAGCLPGEITRMHTGRLEEDIIAQPETWLWSHKRWKHQRVPAGGQQVPV